MNPLLRAVGSLLPAEAKGAIEYHLRPHLTERWGVGPFNGQAVRQLIVADLLRQYEPMMVVETGTYLGTTTAWLATNSGAAAPRKAGSAIAGARAEVDVLPAQIYTVEAVERTYGYARRRLRRYQNVKCSLGDSRSFLRGLPAPGGPVFFYLDAHWDADLPLREEVEIIAERFPQFIVMVDDFQVPGDVDYAYDRYGDITLSLKHFPFDKDRRMRAFFPSESSSRETGRARGCVALVSAQLAEPKTNLLRGAGVPVG